MSTTVLCIPVLFLTYGYVTFCMQNREEFVRLYVQHLLVDSIAAQYEAFAHGFQTVCGGSALRLFQAAETEMLVCGSPELDFKALEASTTYEDGYSL